MRTILLILACVALAGAAARTGREIRVPVWDAQRSNGEGPALTAAEMAVRIDGAEARVTTVLGSEAELLMLLVTDMVGDISLVKPAKEALTARIRAFPSNVYVGLLQAQDGLRVLLDPATDREKVAAAIDSMPVSGKPGLLDTVVTAGKIADSLQRKSRVRVAIVYVTDSDVRDYREDFTNPVVNWSDPHDMSRRFPDGLIREKISRIDAALARIEAPLFIVHLDYRSDKLNEAYQSGLMQLAVTCGGSSVFCRSTAEIPDSIQKMLETVVSSYRVDVELPANVPKIVQVQMESSGKTLSFRQRFVLESR